MSRATISALKATRTAYRMANDILNPHLERPVKPLAPPEPPAVPALPPLHLFLPPIDWTSDNQPVAGVPQARPRAIKQKRVNVGFLVWSGLIILSVATVGVSLWYVAKHG